MSVTQGRFKVLRLDTDRAGHGHTIVYFELYDWQGKPVTVADVCMPTDEAIDLFRVHKGAED